MDLKIILVPTNHIKLNQHKLKQLKNHLNPLQKKQWNWNLSKLGPQNSDLAEKTTNRTKLSGKSLKKNRTKKVESIETGKKRNQNTAKGLTLSSSKGLGSLERCIVSFGIRSSEILGPGGDDSDFRFSIDFPRRALRGGFLNFEKERRRRRRLLSFAF